MEKSHSAEQDESAAVLYLDLLKRCLTDVIYADDPLAGFAPASAGLRTGWRRFAVGVAAAIVRRSGLLLADRARSEADGKPLDGAAIRELRAVGADWPARAHTMVGLRRLDNLQNCIETVIRDEVPGDLAETGVWRGGAAIFMRGVLKAYGDLHRCVWVADSFKGLPRPDAVRYPADRGDGLHSIEFLSVSQRTVERNFQAYGLLDGRVRFLEGWFEDTLPAAPIERLSILRLDGDMYGSTIQVLEALYDKLSPGGFLIVDDYSLEQCRRAVDDFRQVRGIREPVQQIDWTGIFWRKA